MTRCSIEAFTRLQASPLLVRPTPLRTYKDPNSLNEARLNVILNIDAIHGVLEKFHKEVKSNNKMERTRVQRRQNAKKNIQPVNITIGDYVMARTHVKREHKLQCKWGGPWLVKEAKSNLVFVMEDLLSAKQQTLHAQRIMLYPVTRGLLTAFEEL